MAAESPAWFTLSPGWHSIPGQSGILAHIKVCVTQAGLVRRHAASDIVAAFDGLGERAQEFFQFVDVN